MGELGELGDRGELGERGEIGEMLEIGEVVMGDGRDGGNGRLHLCQGYDR